jgi:hypothetical protein
VFLWWETGPTADGTDDDAVVEMAANYERQTGGSHSRPSRPSRSAPPCRLLPAEAGEDGGNVHGIQPAAPPLRPKPLRGPLASARPDFTNRSVTHRFVGVHGGIDRYPVRRRHGSPGVGQRVRVAVRQLRVRWSSWTALPGGAVFMPVTASVWGHHLGFVKASAIYIAYHSTPQSTFLIT